MLHHPGFLHLLQVFKGVMSHTTLVFEIVAGMTYKWAGLLSPSVISTVAEEPFSSGLGLICSEVTFADADVPTYGQAGIPTTTIT